MITSKLVLHYLLLAVSRLHTLTRHILVSMEDKIIFSKLPDGASVIKSLKWLQFSYFEVDQPQNLTDLMKITS